MLTSQGELLEEMWPVPQAPRVRTPLGKLSDSEVSELATLLEDPELQTQELHQRSNMTAYLKIQAAGWKKEFTCASHFPGPAGRLRDKALELLHAHGQALP